MSEAVEELVTAASELGPVPLDALISELAAVQHTKLCEVLKRLSTHYISLNANNPALGLEMMCDDFFDSVVSDLYPGGRSEMFGYMVQKPNETLPAIADTKPGPNDIGPGVQLTAGIERTKMDCLRGLLPEIEAAQAAGYANEDIARALATQGVVVTKKAMESMLSRIRKEIKSANCRTPANEPPTETIAPQTQVGSSDVPPADEKEAVVADFMSRVLPPTKQPTLVSLISPFLPDITRLVREGYSLTQICAYLEERGLKTYPSPLARAYRELAKK